MPHWVEPGQPQLLTEQGGQQKKKEKKKKKKKKKKRRKRKYGRAGQSGAHRKPPPKFRVRWGVDGPSCRCPT